MHKGRVVFGAMDEVVFGEPAAQAVAAQMDRLQKSRAFLMVSGTLRRETDAIGEIERALRGRCAAIFDAMPQHTPREAVFAAAEQASAAEADLIVTVGGGSITDGAKAVQLCLANNIRSVEGMDALRAVKGAPPPMNARPRAPGQRADDDRRRRVFGERRRHQHGHQIQGNRSATGSPSRTRSSSIPGSRCIRPNGFSSRPASAPWIIASRASARARRILMPMLRRSRGSRCWLPACHG